MIHHCRQCGGPTSFVRGLGGWLWQCNYCSAWGAISNHDVRVFENDREAAS